VSTRALPTDTQHTIAPYRYQKSLAETKELLKATIASLPRTRLVEEDGEYLHYEFTSLLIRFVDDVEFVFDEDSKTIHFRSASRIGYGDLGVNRRRMEDIRSSLAGRI
jgi:uncharacterized protein (DUF1499 family)